jgi:hypothetical protein
MPHDEIPEAMGIFDRVGMEFTNQPIVPAQIPDPQALHVQL